MKAFKVHNAETVKQEVNLPAGAYTYSCRVIPVGTSYTFRLDNQSFTFEGLTAGVLNKRMKHTFELTEAVSFFYPSSTVGDCIYEPQIEEGVFATTPGAHPLDFERLISEAGIEIDHEALSLYAKKADVSAEIKIQTDRIDSTVGNISNDVDGVKGDMTTISQTVNSITLTVANHTTQISTFQQTVDQIYASIEDIGSGEFSYILQRLDQIEMKVGAQGQSGSIQLALDSIASTVYDENEGMAAIIQKVNSITSTVYDEHGALLSQISQDGVNVKISGSHIALEGLVTANDNFKILADGSIEAKNGKFTGEINATSGDIGGLIIKDGKLLSVRGTVDGVLVNYSGQQNFIPNIVIDGKTGEIIAGGDKFRVRPDGSGFLANGNIKWNIAGNAEFLGGVKSPFTDISNATIEQFWEEEITSWANNFFENQYTTSLAIRIIPCSNLLNGQVFRIHALRRGILLQPEEYNGFYENGTLLNEIQLNKSDAIEMVCICFNGVFHSWDIVRRYKCRPYDL